MSHRTRLTDTTALAWPATVGQGFPMFFAFESLPLTIIAVSFAVGFAAGILIDPMVRVIRD
jgi:hypothetical protein